MTRRVFSVWIFKKRKCGLCTVECYAMLLQVQSTRIKRIAQMLPRKAKFLNSFFWLSTSSFCHSHRPVLSLMSAVSPCFLQPSPSPWTVLHFRSKAVPWPQSPLHFHQCFLSLYPYYCLPMPFFRVRDRRSICTTTRSDEEDDFWATKLLHRYIEELKRQQALMQ